MKFFQYSFLAFFFSFQAYADDFDFKKAYRIDEIHDAGITGKGYTVSIIEPAVDENHPALKGQIEIIAPSFNNSCIAHGNHVSGLLVGKKIEESDGSLLGEFSGGVIPGAKGHVFSSESVTNYKPENFPDDSLPLLKSAAEHGHVINRSAALAQKSAYDKHLSDHFLKNFKKILEDNDSILIITASNDSAFIGQRRELAYLESLLSDPELMERILIVGNLASVDAADLEKREQSLKLAKEKLSPLLFRYYDEVLEKQAPSEQFNFYTVMRDLQEYLKEIEHADLDFYSLDEINVFFNKDSLEKFKKTLLKSKEDILKELKENKEFILKSSNSAFGGEEDDVVADKIVKLIPMIEHVFNQRHYTNKREQYSSLRKFIKNNSDHKEILKLFDKYFYILERYGWNNNEEYLESITDVSKRINDRLKKIPYDKHNSGIPVSTLAGVAQNDFLLVYGDDILSAWDNNGYSAQTGSSMAAPILSGLVVLLHEYLNVHLKKPTTWKEVLRLIKSSTRKIGDPEVFGLGVLDMEKLFDFEKLKDMASQSQKILGSIIPAKIPKPSKRMDAPNSL